MGYQHTCTDVCIEHEVKQIENQGPKLLVVCHGEATEPGVVDFMGISLIEEDAEGKEVQHVILTLRDWRRAVAHVGGILANVNALVMQNKAHEPSTRH